MVRLKERYPTRHPSFAGTLIAGMRVDAGSYLSATAQILRWAKESVSRYVCVANVHMVMEASDSIAFRAVVNEADLVTADGMPLVWVLRRRGYLAERVYGPTLMLRLCRAAADEGVSIALLGGTQEVLDDLSGRLRGDFPGLQIALTIAPPFGKFTESQDSGYARQIRDSGAGLIFVGLGCPRQEKWMAAMHGRFPGVMVGVGAAFAFHTGRVRQSPAWMQRLGLEWCFRLAMEPRRLWRRYLYHNPRFVVIAVKEEVNRLSAESEDTER